VEPTPAVDVAEIMQQVREQANKQRQKFALAQAASPHRNSQVAEDLSFLHNAQDISQVRLSSHRKIVGDIIISIKRLLQQLLTPVLERQSAYNSVNARLVASLCERVERMEERVASTLDALRAEETAFLDALRATITEQLEGLVQQQATGLNAIHLEVASQSRERRAQERHLTRLVDEVRSRLSPPMPQGQPSERREHQPLDAFFAALSAQLKGTRADLKEGLRMYLTPLKEAKVGTAANPIVDLGCGRGEWLQLLQEAGMQGTGVERNRVLVEECRQAGLDVVESDILTYLCTLPNGSLGAVTGFHIVEHLPLEMLLDVFDEVIRVLQPGGVAIFETPNPRNMLVSTLEFYNDPGHHTLVPSPLLQFIAELKGLERITLLPVHPIPEGHRVPEQDLEIAKRFNELFYGPQDYALVGWKP
jgi:O-antigen chain-terminating methyltransferase